MTSAVARLGAEGRYLALRAFRQTGKRRCTLTLSRGREAEATERPRDRVLPDSRPEGLHYTNQKALWPLRSPIDKCEPDGSVV